MSLFNFFKKTSRPGNLSVPNNSLYEMLFCDDVELYGSLIKDKRIFPWSVLFANPVSIERLISLQEDPGAETRVRLLASHLLRQYGQPPAKKELLAVIIEVALEQGLDVLASYQDGSARFISHGGKVIIWDVSNSESDKLTQTLFEHSEQVIKQIGPWEKGRLNAPKKGNSRITFLISDDLYFGEAPTDVLFNDPLVRETLSSATALLDYLTHISMYSDS
jgi:hypothetical protein